MQGDQTENHSTKCDTKKKTEETEKNRKEPRNKKREKRWEGKDRDKKTALDFKEMDPAVKPQGYLRGAGQAASL